MIRLLLPVIILALAGCSHYESLRGSTKVTTSADQTLGYYKLRDLDGNSPPGGGVVVARYEKYESGRTGYYIDLSPACDFASVEVDHTTGALKPVGGSLEADGQCQGYAPESKAIRAMLADHPHFKIDGPNLTITSGSGRTATFWKPPTDVLTD